MVTVSVVMSVFNGAAMLERTMRSILEQTLRDFELIVVDDGSADDTPRLLARFAAEDPRVRVLSQENTGLTRALIRGCAEARGTYIARHDNADWSHRERFAKQVAMLEEGHVLVACAARYLTPEGHTLYVARADGEESRRSLRRDPVEKIRGLPHHGAAMFRRDAYEAVGGYRAQFRVAQDVDLWIRLAEIGSIAIDDEVLYESTFDPTGISGVARERQILAGTIAIAIRDGGDETTLLEQASQLVRARRVTPRREADGFYFVARCLLAEKNPAWRDYAWRAVKRWPLHARALWTLMTGR